MTVRRDLLDILCCPSCKGELRLEAKEERDGEIEAGTLVCTRCGHSYPIEDGIPNLLPPEVAGESRD